METVDSSLTPQDATLLIQRGRHLDSGTFESGRVVSHQVVFLEDQKYNIQDLEFWTEADIFWFEIKQNVVPEAQVRCQYTPTVGMVLRTGLGRPEIIDRVGYNLVRFRRLGLTAAVATAATDDGLCFFMIPVLRR